jgi:hypothetical protein
MLGRFGTRRGLWTNKSILGAVGFLWQERAAIAEFDGGLSREQAVELAWCRSPNKRNMSCPPARQIQDREKPRGKKQKGM